KNRKPTALGGRSIPQLDGVQAKVAQMERLILASRSALYGSVEERLHHPEHRDSLGPQLAAAKMIATNNAIEIAELAMRIVGSGGMQRANPLERYCRDVRAGLGNPPIDDVAQGQIARFTLGL